MAFNGLAQSMGIGLAIYLDDHFTRTSEQVKNEMKLLGVEARQLEKGLNDMQDFGSGMEAVGQKVLGFAMKGLDTYAKYEDIMNSVKVIGQFPEAQAKSILAGFDTLNMGLAKKYGVLPEAIASAQLELAKAGKKSKEIQNMTSSVVALGAATDTAVDGVNGSAEILVNIMQAYGAASDEANRYAAVITSTANQSTIDVKDFAQSMKYTGDIATLMGVSIEEAGAVIATLGNAGLKGSIAGTTYANMMRYLSQAASEFRTQGQSASMDLLGIDSSAFINKEGEVRSMTEVIQNLRAALVGMSQNDAVMAIQKLFGVRGARALPLLKSIVESQEGIYSFEDNLAKIIADRDNNVHLQQAVDRLNDTKGDLDKLKSSINTMFIQFGASIAPMARNFIQRLTGAIDKVTEFMSTPIMQKAFAVLTSTAVMTVIAGKMIQGIAGFGLFLIRFNSNFKVMLTLMKSITQAHSTQTRASGNIFLASAKQMLKAAQTNLMAAKGMSIIPNSRGSGTTIVGRGAGGKITGRVKNSGWLVRWGAALGGLKGARMAGKVVEWFAKVGAAVPWLTKGVGYLGKVFGWGKILVSVLGRAVGWLLGWKVMLIEMGIQMVFGVSIFEELWNAIVKLVTNVDKWGDYLANFSTYLGDIMTAGWWSKWTTGKEGAFSKDMEKVSNWFTPGHYKDPETREYEQQQKAKRDSLTAAQHEEVNRLKPLMFNGGKLVEQEGLKTKTQSSSSSVTTNKQTVVKEKPVTVNLTVQAPAEGSYKRTLNLDDKNLLGSAIA